MKRLSRFTMCRSLTAFGGRGIVLCLAAVLFGAPRVFAAEDQQQKGVALITRAAQLQNLLAPDTGPFHLRAHVKLLGLVDGTREGDYLLMAASQAQWFEQTRFPGYSELTGFHEGQAWRKRNVIDKTFRFP